MNAQDQYHTRVTLRNGMQLKSNAHDVPGLSTNLLVVADNFKKSRSNDIHKAGGVHISTKRSRDSKSAPEI